MVNGIVIHGVILVVRGGQENGIQPNTLNAQALAGIGIAVIEIVKSVDQSTQIADAIPVGVGKRAHKNLIKHPVIGLIGHCRAQPLEQDLTGHRIGRMCRCLGLCRCTTGNSQH